MENIIGWGVGALVAVLGIYMAVTGDYRLLHGYHYATTPPAERPALARETGICLIGCGAGIALIIPSVLPAWTTILGVVLLVASIVGIVASIIRHNGGLVTFDDTDAQGDSATKRWWRPLAVCGVLGALLSLLGIVPGLYMIVTGDVSLLHSYHYANVTPADIPSLAYAEGLCMVGLGVSVFVCVFAAGGMRRRPFPLWSKSLMAAGVLLWCACLVAMIVVIIHFNGSLMG